VFKSDSEKRMRS